MAAVAAVAVALWMAVGVVGAVALLWRGGGGPGALRVCVCTAGRVAALAAVRQSSLGRIWVCRWRGYRRQWAVLGW